jgi:hypothetical protein
VSQRPPEECPNPKEPWSKELITCPSWPPPLQDCILSTGQDQKEWSLFPLGLHAGNGKKVLRPWRAGVGTSGCGETSQQKAGYVLCRCAAQAGSQPSLPQGHTLGTRSPKGTVEHPSREKQSHNSESETLCFALGCAAQELYRDLTSKTQRDQRSPFCTGYGQMRK